MDWQVKLSEAIDRIRHAPNNIDLRLELIQYLCMCGNWERALKQISQFQKIFPYQNQSLMLYLLNNVEAELRREKVFHADYRPLTLAQDAKSELILERHLSVLAFIQEQNKNELFKIYEQLANSTPDATVTISYTTTFGVDMAEEMWLIDGDVRTAFVCELFIDGRYYWQPWHTFSNIQFNPPKAVLDTIWRSVEVTLHNKKSFRAYIPARYSCLEVYNDASLLSCAATTWHSLDIEGLYIGRGQKLLYGEQKEYPFLDIQSLIFS